MPKPSFWGTLVLTLLGSVALGLATNVASGDLPGWFEPYKWTAWGLVPVLGTAYALVQWRLERRRTAEAAPERVRALLISEQRRWWIADVLERSLHHEARVALSYRSSVDEEHPWKLRVNGTDEVTRRPIEAIFDADMNGWMAILGAPGAGKTTTLLELLRVLLDRAEDGGPVPLLLNLASWEGRVEEWAAREAASRYRARGPVAGWLASGEVVLLLDGLDEVAENRREDCLRAVNAFLAAHPATSTVVCCRSEEYAALDGKLALRGRVEIEPLSSREVDAYLRRHRLPHARAVLAADGELRSLVTSPLLLAVLTIAYRDTPRRAGDGDALSRLFEAYLARMLEQRPGRAFPAERLLPQLRFLAAGMRERDQTLFGFDDLDDTWSPERVRVRWRLGALPYVVLLTGLGWWWHAGFGAAIGLAAGLAFLLPNRQRIDMPQLRDMWEQRRRGETVKPPDVESAWELVPAALYASAAGLLTYTSHGRWAALFYGFCAFLAYLAAHICSAMDPPGLGGPRDGELPSPGVRSFAVQLVAVSPLLVIVWTGLALLIISWTHGPWEALPFAVLCATAVVGYAVHANVQHLRARQRSLRRVLARHGLLALPAAPWLDHARDCLILRKVGRDYMFVHLLLRDHLAGPA